MHEYNMDNTEPPSPNCMPVLLSVLPLNIHALIIIDVTHFTLQTRIKNIKNVTRCRDSRSAKSIETR